MSYDITYMWNIKNDIKLNYLQNRNRLTDIANKLIVAAAAAKSLQSFPSGFPIPGILQARTMEWVAISSSNALK